MKRNKDFTHKQRRRIDCWVVAGCLFALGQFSLYAQQSKIPWSSHSAGFAIMTSERTAVKSSVGQMALGSTLNSSIIIEGGFLTDTTLRGLLLAVHDENELPLSCSLEQNYPNPFNPATSIRYSVGSPPDGRTSSQYVNLTIYDVLGREVQTLVSETKLAGTYTARWDAHGFPSGVYFYRLQSGNFIETRKLILVK